MSMSRSEPTARRYTTTAIVLHWGIALLLAFEFARGFWMQDIPKQPVGPRVDAYNLHKSFGLAILALVLFRLGWRLRHPAPPLPAMPAWQSRIAAATHLLLYAAMIALPLSGYLGSAFSGYPVKFFGTTLPAWAPASESIKALMSVVHTTLSWILAGATLLHIAGAARHGFAADGLLARMGIGPPARTPP